MPPRSDVGERCQRTVVAIRSPRAGRNRGRDASSGPILSRCPHQVADAGHCARRPRTSRHCPLGQRTSMTCERSFEIAARTAVGAQSTIGAPVAFEATRMNPLRASLRASIAGLVVLGGGAGEARATTYHVAVTGSDANPGTDVQPLLTIGACAALAQPGDVCTVHAGTYRETVSPPRSGIAAAHIRFEAAAGECATVSGADPLTLSWRPYAGSIVVALTSASFIQLFANGQALNEARWPNADPA